MCMLLLLVPTFAFAGENNTANQLSMQSPIQSTTKFVPKSLKLKSGTNYTAKITGTAIGSNLVSTFTAKVISNAKINFKY